MQQLKIILKRLTTPSVAVSIVSQIALILAIFNINIEVDKITSIIIAIGTILVALGILSDPTTKTKGYGDDLKMCSNCKTRTKHVLVAGKLMCNECGHKLEQEQEKVKIKE